MADKQLKLFKDPKLCGWCGKALEDEKENLCKDCKLKNEQGETK